MSDMTGEIEIPKEKPCDEKRRILLVGQSLAFENQSLEDVKREIEFNEGGEFLVMDMSWPKKDGVVYNALLNSWGERGVFPTIYGLSRDIIDEAYESFFGFADDVVSQLKSKKYEAVFLDEFVFAPQRGAMHPTLQLIDKINKSSPDTIKIGRERDYIISFGFWALRGSEVDYNMNDCRLGPHFVPEGYWQKEGLVDAVKRFCGYSFTMKSPREYTSCNGTRALKRTIDFSKQNPHRYRSFIDSRMFYM